MNVFITHSGSDKDFIVHNIIPQIEKLEPRANLLALKNGGVFWKIEAKGIIKKAQMVLFIVGENSHQSKNISWELKQAHKRNKLILYYKLNDKNKINDCIYGVERFSGKKKILAEEAHCVEDIVKRVKRYENSEYDLFNNDIDKIDRNELLEQYKVFLETSESLVSRRQSVNSFYISANTALITIMATLITMFGNLGEKLVICVLVSVVGFVLTLSWHSVLSSYGILNSSKMKVISIIEQKLPASLYDTEWDVMSDKLNSKKYISFTESEKKAPKAFAILYGILIFAVISIAIGLKVVHR